MHYSNYELQTNAALAHDEPTLRPFSPQQIREYKPFWETMKRIEPKGPAERPA
jgi:hypothetical protein